MESVQTRSTASQFAGQWQRPDDILSVLMILGPDIITRAIAQLCGETITPVVFSYGWAAYAVNALLVVFGGMLSLPVPGNKTPADQLHIDGEFMPEPDGEVLVIGAKSGHSRNNKSWVIGRLLRDFEDSRKMKPSQFDKSSPDYEALCVSVFQVNTKFRPGVPVRDWIWYSGFVVAVIQIGISAAPLGISGDWAPLVVTIGGTVLAALQSAIPQSREEKWACPTRGGWTVSITQGNGSRNVMVILGNDYGLDLEILAGKSKRIQTTTLTRIVTTALAALWLVFLISVAGLHSDPWYLLAVGLIGMIHNLVVAAAARSPGAHGIHLNQIDTISDSSVEKVLRRTEDRYPLVGSSLLSVFFEGGFSASKENLEFWMRAEERRQATGLSKLAIKTD